MLTQFLSDTYSYFFGDNHHDTKFYYLSLIKEDDECFSIHGLWPQYTENVYPSYCQSVDFSLETLDPIMGELKNKWYSNRGPDDTFWKHEYEKHGSCVFTPMTELKYFKTTCDLYDQVITLGLAEKYYNPETKKCLIPVNLDFTLFV